MIDVLAGLPLVYHPGASWEYSVATDVLGRLVEIVSGRRFDDFIQSRILGPLGMVERASSCRRRIEAASSRITPGQT